jgi:tRNA 2-thiouridine synthesizing protein A
MATRTLDIRGLICPVTWARVRRELTGLAAGDLLEVTLDHRPALPDIRRNTAELGHDVVSEALLSEGVWRVVIEVGPESAA